MNEKEKPQKKRINDIEREEIPNMVDNVTLGDELLEKEFKRQKTAEDLLTKHKSDKET